MRIKKENPQKQDSEEEIREGGRNSYLILHNDNVHSFEFVINSLVDICEHDMFQAEQCAFIVHYKGKCDVKKGTYNNLYPLKYKLIENGLQASIE